MSKRRKPLPHQLLWEARTIAEAHGLYIIDVQQRVFTQGVASWVTARVIYRRSAHSRRGIYVGKSRTPQGLLLAVKKAAGISKEKTTTASEAVSASR